ncbi:putative tubulin-specific chaperone [Aspergillus sclerotioniger CBS 115572]|uniref:Tubulin-specific chaperone E n=1 Tax=Aspergillus sclerotioniger CBS 115572 TaxID=1450535 RepID=A0A317XBI2_9EURO|nr:putative tubulin-specific chaperone [Aspergillus sclerotioniger CBS 115572]PWY95042.1 putative tubulin-specific chaperone [Aspergillus sclerotioniger CBS 115572]
MLEGTVLGRSVVGWFTIGRYWEMESAQVGQRRSYAGDLCTVRYVGSVEGTSGEWLGVEWDDPTRGKHSGEHRGVRYFTCKSKHPTAGSFVRPSRPADKPRGFLEALREKYASETLDEDLARQKQGESATDDALHKPIEISGKVVEEVGFDKIRKQLARLQELKIVLLDGLRVVGVLHDAEVEEVESAYAEIEQTCPEITELDLSQNLLTSWSGVARICKRLKLLKRLKLIGNRLGPLEEGLKFEGITALHIDETFLTWEEISALTYQFPALTSLSASANQISMLSMPLSNSITRLTLENNDLTSLSSIKSLTPLPSLEHLSLRGNSISTVYNSPVDKFQFSHSLHSLDISRNKITTWDFVNQLSSVFPGLDTLRISGNPLYDQPIGPSHITGVPEKPMTVDEAYMLTLSRIASLQLLNYGKITAKDRNNGELYYLSLIGKELSAFPETAESRILAAHPRYRELCELYGQPVIRRVESGPGAAVNPRSVAARLVKLVFHLSQTGIVQGENTGTSGSTQEAVKIKEVPRSFDTYQLKAIVSRLFGLPPYGFKLIWETDELDPVSKEKMEDDEGWDSEDEGGLDSAIEKDEKSTEESGFVKREVELVDTTKDIGFWFQSDLVEARIRVEV